MIPSIIAALAAAALPLQDAPPQDAPTGDTPQRIRSVILYGEEQCPPSTDPDEIVVCAREGDSPYRIPERFRDQRSERPDAQSWVRRVEVIEEVNRAGLPNSCSPIGMGGQSGCTRQQLQRWAQERLEAQRQEATVP